jgi:LPS-assembly protein
MGRVWSLVLLLAGACLGGLLLPDAAAAQGRPEVTIGPPGDEVTVLADRLEQVGPDGLLVATGDVEITRGTARLLADRVEIDRESGAMVAHGRAIFYDGEDRLAGERIEYNYRTGTGVVYEGRARVEPYYHVAGRRLERLGPSLYRVTQGLLTTCEDEPPAWSVRFRSATVDLEEALWGRDASVWVRNLPLIPFIPFFAAAIRRERQTGFLFPRLGQSSFKGAFAEVPFFWAISDSQDATITPLLYSERGFGASLEYRYILSETHRGDLSGFYLRETEVSQREEGRDVDRGYLRFRHDWLLTPRLSLRADVNAVTDDFVLHDYGDRLHDRSAQRAESTVFLTWTGRNWSAVGELFWYQDLTTRRPVELNRLPDVAVTGFRQPVPGLPGFLYEFEGSGTRVVRDLGSDGTRFDLHPRLVRPLPVLGFVALTPFVGGRLTTYDKTVVATRVVDGITVEDTRDDPRIRSLVEAGTDAEARATRIYELGGFAGLDAVLHSIEPRLGYTWIAGANTDRIPDWGSPIDAVRPASLITYSLTNRVRARSVAPAGTEPARWEYLRFTMAGSYDLRREDRPWGDARAELIVDPNRILVFRGDTTVDVYGAGIRTATTDVSLNVPRVSAGAGTRYSRDERVNFLQAHATAELTRWLVGRVETNWDMRTNTLVENRVAADLRWQCWALTVEFVSRSEGGDELRFALNLLGLGAPLTTSTGIGGLTGGVAGRVK